MGLGCDESNNFYSKLYFAKTHNSQIIDLKGKYSFEHQKFSQTFFSSKNNLPNVDIDTSFFYYMELEL